MLPVEPLIDFAVVPQHSAWLVAVSGGADSVALLRCLCESRADLDLVVAHLNHETRGTASDEDAAFVQSLAQSLGLRCEVGLRSDVERSRPHPLDENPSARYRAARLAYFKQLVDRHALTGALLAHHADDVAETTLLRLLRGGEPSALAGLRPVAHVEGLKIVRPLLNARRSDIEAYLRSIGQPWREDASNASGDYARNRVRRLLRGRAEWCAALRSIARAARDYGDAITAKVPELADEPNLDRVADLAAPIARRALRMWLAARGVTDVERPVIDLLHEMTRDRASPARVSVGSQVSVERARGALRIVRGN